MSENSDDTKIFGEEIYGPGKTFFEDVVMDNLMDAFLELTATVWTYRDRSIVLEKVLQEVVGDQHNITELIEQYRPTPEDNAARAAEREEMINRIFESFSRRPK